MFEIKNKNDLISLVYNDESAKFLVDIYSLIDTEIEISDESDKRIALLVKHSKGYMSLVIENNIILQKSFYKNKMNYSYREENKPTDISFDSKGNWSNKSWRIGDEYRNDIRFVAVNVTKSDHKNPNYAYSYRKEIKDPINISYIIFSSSKNKVIDCLINYYGKNLSFKESVEKFPELVNLSLDDCYDLNTKVFTDDVLTLHGMINIC